MTILTLMLNKAAMAIAVTQGSTIVVFLGTQCPQCKKWLNILKVVHGRTDLPDIIGVVAAPAEVARGYAEHYALNFPLVTIQPALFSTLITQVPTAVVLEDGVIREKWVRAMPQSFIEQIASGDLTVPEGQPHVVMAQ
ncbi:MAG: hypothetical protein HC866_21310 [Leptolyngbyaceae cyanobacterium RU_5_1]|nr:hypothetical protein [Leptolyngbyaceae cyanobacterium RU_5_1]